MFCGIVVAIVGYHGWIGFNWVNERMETSKDLSFANRADDSQNEVDPVREKKFCTDSSASQTSIERTVNWIGQDSESQPDEYLAEYNTRQCGE